jgi:signal transduction histidine kinase
MLLLRTRVTDNILSAQLPSRRLEASRVSLLVADGDTILVLATTSRDSTPMSSRRIARSQAPAHVRDAFGKPNASGMANDGLVRSRVFYMSAGMADRNWAMLLETDAFELVGNILAPLFAELLFVMSMFLLVFAYLRSQRRVAAMRREQVATEVRADFVTAVSHELRTPLAQIRMFAELLQNGSLKKQEESARALHVIEKEASRLSILVDNVLRYTSLKRASAIATSEQRSARTEVERDVRYVIESFSPLAAENDATIVDAAHESASAAIDSDAFRQILLNLLENAVKYGPKGQTITVGSSQSATRVRVWVSDEGPGVPKSERAAIWSAFERGSAAKSSGAGGSGIGLSVVKDLVERHGGTVWVDTSPSGGACFVVELPRSMATLRQTG